MNNTSTDLTTMTGNKGETLTNTEWQLAEMVDAIAGEIDRAEDTLALKSYARGMLFSIRQLSLDLQVVVRRDDNGSVKFRTADPNSTSATTIKLDFAQILKNQLGDDRQKLGQDIDRRPLDVLGLNSEEIRALNAISIYSIDDFRRYTQTAAMVSEVSRKTNIYDARLREVLGLPYIKELKPDRGLPDSKILLEGGNFGAVQPSRASVYFQGVPLQIVTWSNTRIQVEIPSTATGNGAIFIVINDQISNTIDWQVPTVDLIVKDITITPSNPRENDEITLTASLVNQGSSAASSFAVQWSIDGQKQTPKPHGVLPPNQASQESSLVWKTRLSAGEHKLSFTADPDQKLADVDRANSTFSKTITVAATQKSVSLGDYHVIDSLDPFVSEQPWELRQGVLGLIYRGLMRLDPINVELLLHDLSLPPRGRKEPVLMDSNIRVKPGGPILEDQLKPGGPIGDDLLTPRVTYQLRQDVRFHDDTTLTAEDVVFSYNHARKSSAWAEMLSVIINIKIVDRTTVVFTLVENLAVNIDPKIWTLPIVPARTYQADSGRFVVNPIGCGPFIAALKQDGKSGNVQLKAFEQYYLGAPRLKTLSIELQPDVDVLIRLLVSGQLKAIVLPDARGLTERLKSLGDRYQIIRTTTGSSTVLHVQDRSLLERLPNNYETAWNAHLWYTI